MTPPGAGAVAIIQLQGDIDSALEACGMRPPAVGEVKLRDLCGVDRGVVARFTQDMCQFMPHGGVAVVRALAVELSRRGIVERHDPDLRDTYSEARSQVEARALAALARAASPMAVDLLLAQHELWTQAGAASDPERDGILNRLIDPPLVVALGASNIGKSTLVNALAGRSVSIVADEPGTTRDHVGVVLDLAGLVVRYVDTPGLRTAAGDIELEAVAGSIEVASRADLLLLCGDATAAPPELPTSLVGKPALVVALRSDLGGVTFKADASVSIVGGQGVAGLVQTIRQRLVPVEFIQSVQPWRFW
jgi:tRNA modification GTPase